MCAICAIDVVIREVGFQRRRQAPSDVLHSIGSNLLRTPVFQRSLTKRATQPVWRGCKIRLRFTSGNPANPPSLSFTTDFGG